MKAFLNLVSLVMLGALAAGIWLSQNRPAALEEIEAAVMPEPDPAPVADTIPDDPAEEPDAGPDTGETGETGDATATGMPEPVPAGYTVEGTQPGYFIADSEIVFNGYRLQHIQAEPAHNGFDESVRLALEDTGRVAGTNDRGEYYETVALDVEAYAITPEGVSITASHPDIGTVAVEGSYDAFSYEAWTSGADAVETLFTADVTIGGATIEDVPFSFWVGD